MKKIKLFTTVFIILCMLFCIAGCNNAKVTTVHDDIASTSMFIEVERSYTWTVVYHRYTKVMYVVSAGNYNYGTFTLMVDENGDPLLYEE